MRLLELLLLSIVLTNSLTQAKPVVPLLRQDQLRWNLATTKLDGATYLSRVAGNVDSLIRTKALNDVVGLAVPFLHDGDRQEIESLNRFEDLVLSQCCSGEKSRLVVVMTGRSMREFVFQSRDGAALIRQLHNMSEYAGGHQLQTFVERDPNWDTWREFNEEKRSDKSAAGRRLKPR